MDTMSAFAKGEANRGKAMMGYDKVKIKKLMKEHNLKEVQGGLLPQLLSSHPSSEYFFLIYRARIYPPQILSPVPFSFTPHMASTSNARSATILRLLNIASNFVSPEKFQPAKVQLAVAVARVPWAVFTHGLGAL